jgi:cytochrome P450
MVISELLGIPNEDREALFQWVIALIDSGFPANQSAYQEALAFVSYLRTFIARKRTHPGEDLMSRLTSAEEAGDTLSESELISTIFVLIIAGYDTTVNLIGNGTLALLLHPDQMRKLQNDPSLIISAVEELLRFASPVGASTMRWANEDMEMYGQMISRGDVVFASILSANSDPTQFHDPEVLDIVREDNKHIAFGRGIHYCLGAPLARLEGQIAFSTVLRRLPHLRLNVDPAELTWRPNISIRGLSSLPVTF